MTDLRSDFLRHALAEAQRYRTLGEGALEQVNNEEFFREVDPESNSLAILVKHLGGNLRSRWRDFLTTDGEKPDRHRDQEFLLSPDDSRVSLMNAWAEGWSHFFATLEGLDAADLERTVTIRLEPHSVVQAILRQLAHTAYHVGQIVQLARHFRGESWRSLSVPRGESERFNQQMREKHGSA